MAFDFHSSECDEQNVQKPHDMIGSTVKYPSFMFSMVVWV